MIDFPRYLLNTLSKLGLFLRHCTCNSKQLPPDGGEVLPSSYPGLATEIHTSFPNLKLFPCFMSMGFEFHLVQRN